MSEGTIESVTGSYEELFLNHEIFVQPNRDPYRGGYEWFVCLDGNELDAGLESSVEDALTSARQAASALAAAK